MTRLQLLVQALNARRYGADYLARCPAHSDKNPSLSIAERNGRVLVHCHAGCTQRDVLSALRRMGMTLSERRQS